MGNVIKFPKKPDLFKSYIQKNIVVDAESEIIASLQLARCELRAYLMTREEEVEENVLILLEQIEAKYEELSMFRSRT